MGSSLVYVAFLMAFWLPSGSWAINCTAKPAPTVLDVYKAWTTPLLGCPMTPLLTNELNGKTNTNFAKLIIPAGQGFPPHRHNGAEEYLFFTKGSGEVNVLLPGEKLKNHSLKPGDFHFLPPWGIHDVKASATEELEMIVMTSPTPFVIETFEAFPETTDVPVGTVVDILSFMTECPPGQEDLTKDEL